QRRSLCSLGGSYSTFERLAGRAPLLQATLRATEAQEATGRVEPQGEACEFCRRAARAAPAARSYRPAASRTRAWQRCAVTSPHGCAWSCACQVSVSVTELARSRSPSSASASTSSGTTGNTPGSATPSHSVCSCTAPRSTLAAALLAREQCRGSLCTK